MYEYIINLYESSIKLENINYKTDFWFSETNNVFKFYIICVTKN